MRPSAKAVRAGLAPTKRISCPSRCAPATAGSKSLSFRLPRRRSSPSMRRRALACDRLDQHVDALEDAQFADEHKIGGCRPARSTAFLGLPTPLCTDADKRSRFGQALGEARLRPYSLSNRNRSVRRVSSRSAQVEKARQASSSGSAGCRRAACNAEARARRDELRIGAAFGAWPCRTSSAQLQQRVAPPLRRGEMSAKGQYRGASAHPRGAASAKASAAPPMALLPPRRCTGVSQSAISPTSCLGRICPRARLVTCRKGPPHRGAQDMQNLEGLFGAPCA